MSHTGLTTCPGCPGRRDPGVHVAVVAVHEVLPHRPAVMVAARELPEGRRQVFADCSCCSLAGPHPGGLHQGRQKSLVARGSL